ncbi:hypothetical protein SEA_CECE_226 [Microbacterium phage Cece]|nr:hypothetical protein SEA_CECE_226 [Microbacterium phage Cece]
MSNFKVLVLRAIRGFFGTVWLNPDAWLYWDRKVIAARKDAQRGS